MPLAITQEIEDRSGGSALNLKGIQSGLGFMCHKRGHQAVEMGPFPLSSNVDCRCTYQKDKETLKAPGEPKATWDWLHKRIQKWNKGQKSYKIDEIHF